MLLIARQTLNGVVCVFHESVYMLSVNNLPFFQDMRDRHNAFRKYSSFLFTERQESIELGKHPEGMLSLHCSDK